MRIAAILAFAALAFGGAAIAADDDEAVGTTTQLASGVEVQSSLHRAPSVGDNFYRCFQLDTERGSKWTIHVTQKKYDGQYLQPAIFPGGACNGKQVNADRKNAYEPKLVGGDYSGAYATFASGGGTYSIFVYAPKASDFGMFKITATQVAGAGAVKTGLAASTDDIAIARAFGKETASTASEREGAPERKTGDIIKDCADCPSLVVVPAGAFTMGSTAAEEDRNANEGPAHRVTFARPFAIGQLEVTFDQWDACVAAGACVAAKDGGWGRGKRPVINVSFNDARAYVVWLSKKTGERYFLPSESEWEYAARAGSKTPWNTGSGISSDDANILNTFKQTVPGGGFPANAFGLSDVHGNVWEWVLDCYEIGYFGVPADGGASVTPDCPSRVIRGGSYASEPKYVRSATRGAYPVETATPEVGFRVARAL